MHFSNDRLGPMRLGWTVPRRRLLLLLAPVMIASVIAMPGDRVTAAAPPSLTLAPSSGRPGTAVTITGQNFAPRSPVRIAWQGFDGRLPGTFTDRNGSFSLAIPVLAQNAGSYRVTATVDGRTAAATFRVIAAAPPFQIILGAEEEAFPDLKLGSFPDTHISTVNVDGRVSLFLSAEVRAYLLQGASLEQLRPALSDADGAPIPVLAPSGSGFDSGYAAFGQVIPSTRVPGELIGLFHAETCGRRNYTASIGVAASTDGGVSWSRRGVAITGRNADSSCDKPAPRGAGQPSAVVVGDYLYVYYTDWGGDVPDEIHVARVPLDQAGQPDAYVKYYDGGWSEPGVGGRSTPVIVRPEPGRSSVYAANASVSYNVFLGCFLATFGSNDGFYTTTSTDGVAWEPAELLSALPFPQASGAITTGSTWYAYATLVSPDGTTNMQTARTGYLYYSKGVKGVTVHRAYRRPFTIRSQ